MEINEEELSTTKKLSIKKMHNKEECKENGSLEKWQLQIHFLMFLLVNEMINRIS